MNHQRLARAIGLFGLLAAIYFLTYTGLPISTDEEMMFDAAHSLINGRRLELGYANSYRPLSVPIYRYEPVMGLDTEPMQAYAAAPLVWLGSRLPGVGVLQTAWIFNILVTALTAVLLYYYGTALGYSDTASLLTALAFGLATYAWAYSKLFFREPLFALLVLTCAYCLERWRQHLEARRFRVGWLVTAVLALGGAMLTKEALVLVVPGLLILVLPGTLRRLLNWRILLTMAGLVALIAVGALIYQQVSGNARYDLVGRLRQLNLDSLPVALPAFLISPGFSLWAFSPVLLLGLAGLIQLLRQKRLRQALAPLTIFAALVTVYSVARGSEWYGGTGWGPRYLLPAVPMLMLWLLPVFETLLKRSLPMWIQAAAFGLIAYSVFLQAMSTFISLAAFPTVLSIESFALDRPIVAWQEGVWRLLYNPLIILAREPLTTSPVAWLVNGSGLIVVPLCLIAAAIALIVLIRRCDSKRGVALRAGVVIFALSLMALFGLRSYYRDPRLTNDPLLWKVLERLDAEIQPGDVVLLNDTFHMRFMMNYYKHAQPIYALRDAPGERLGYNATPEIVTDENERQVHPFTTALVPRALQETRRFWFVTQFSPYSPGRLRPTERYLTRHYPLAREAVSEVTARLLLFSATPAPSDRIPPWPLYPVQADFSAVTLIGYDLPVGATIKPGSLLPVSLLWQHTSWPEGLQPFDYSLNLSLVRAGNAVAQWTGQPMQTFEPMSQWVKGGYYRGNYALDIPAGLPAGDYELLVLLYRWDNNAPLPVRRANGSTTDRLVIGKIRVAP